MLYILAFSFSVNLNSNLYQSFSLRTANGDSKTVHRVRVTVHEIALRFHRMPSPVLCGVPRFILTTLSDYAVLAKH